MDIDFKNLIALTNRAGAMNIDLEPVEARQSRWGLFRGAIQAGAVQVPLEILYLHPKLSREDFNRALRVIGKSGGGRIRQIIYADSLVDDKRFPAVARDDDNDGIQRIGVRAFFSSFAQQQLNAYVNQIRTLYRLDDYVSPDLSRESTGRDGSKELFDRLFGRVEAGRKASLNVVLAEPGQGKTYLSKSLAHRIVSAGRIPLFVTSAQWTRLSPGDMSSLWKTMLHSFREHGSPIMWADGAEEEFVRVAQKCGLFTLIFDGFDEYVLRTGSDTNATDTVRRFEELALDTQSPILLTCRTVFWNSEVAEFFEKIDDVERSTFHLQPFQRKHAKIYFEQRFKEEERSVASAIEIFDHLRKAGTHERHDLVGRGYFLYLVADLVQGGAEGGLKRAAVRSNPIAWICDRLCERERTRQSLPLTIEEQFGIFEELSELLATDGPASTQTVALIIQSCTDLGSDEIRNLVGEDGGRAGKLASHPLLSHADRLTWSFRQEQLFFFFLAKRVHSQLSNRSAEARAALRHFLGRLEHMRQLQFEIATWLLEKLGATLPLSAEMKETVRGLAALESESYQQHESRGRSSIATALAVQLINRLGPRIDSRLGRTALLQELFGERVVKNLFFSDALSGFDFCGARFENCRFENLTFLRCGFDESTFFKTCTFEGVTVVGSPAIQDAHFDVDCVLDERFRRRLLTGKDNGVGDYSFGDLKSDFDALLNGLMPSEATTGRILTASALAREGAVSSPFHGIALQAIKSHILEEVMTKSGEVHFGIRPAAVPAMRFFKGNGIYTGLLSAAWEDVLSKAKLRG